MEHAQQLSVENVRPVRMAAANLIVENVRHVRMISV